MWIKWYKIKRNWRSLSFLLPFVTFLRSQPSSLQNRDDLMGHFQLLNRISECKPESLVTSSDVCKLEHCQSDPDLFEMILYVLNFADIEIFIILYPRNNWNHRNGGKVLRLNVYLKKIPAVWTCISAFTGLVLYRNPWDFNISLTEDLSPQHPSVNNS